MTAAFQNSYGVLIVSGSEKASGRLVDLLPEERFAPAVTVSAGSLARRKLLDAPFDLLLINAPLPDEYGTELALTAASNPQLGVLLLVPADLYESTADAVESAGVLTLGKPTNPQLVYQSLRLLMATRRRLAAMEEKNTTLASKMDEIRLVNRAKWVLIQQLKMDEAAAHRYLEKQAMDARISRREVAERILLAYEN